MFLTLRLTFSILNYFYLILEQDSHPEGMRKGSFFCLRPSGFAKIELALIEIFLLISNHCQLTLVVIKVFVVLGSFLYSSVVEERGLLR